MEIYGLIGKSLKHSFSPAYFKEKFLNLKLDHKYLAFELETIDQLQELVKAYPNLKGFNVTIPYKEAIIPFLDEIDEVAQTIGAANCVKIENGRLKGYNTDAPGFQVSLSSFLNHTRIEQALILGTGGASKAVACSLKQINIPFQFVSRSKKTEGMLGYQDLNKTILGKSKLIINTTPIGTWPETNSFPEIPYQYITDHHFLFDLIYNPEQTLFLEKGKLKGAKIKNGLEMLINQAEFSWEIWKENNL